MHTLLRSALVATLLLFGARAFAAAQSVILLGVSGSGGDRFADGIEQDLGELYQVVPGEVYRRTAEKLGHRGAAPEDVRAVCGSLHIDALVAGTVTGAGEQRQLVIVTRTGRTGAVISRRRYDLARRTLVQVREEVVRNLVLELEAVPPASAGPAYASPTPVASTNDEPNAPEETISSAPSAPRSGGGESRRQPFYFGAGAALMGRSLSFDTGSQGYRGTAVGALAIDGGVFPFEFSPEIAEAHPVLSAFGVAGSYERAFQFTSSSAAYLASQAHASRWSALLLARIRAGHNGGVTLEGGFQRISWSAGSQVEVGVPDVSYALIDFGVSFEHTLGTRYLELGVRIAAEGMVDAGNLTGKAEYGPARGGGLDLSAGLTARPLRWLWLRAGGGYTPLFIAFQSAGGRLAHRATDQIADGLLEVGFAL